MTFDLRDAPVRQALELVFNDARTDYTIDNRVDGFVTLKATNQSYDNVLDLIARATSTPLLYVREGGVVIVKSARYAGGLAVSRSETSLRADSAPGLLSVPRRLCGVLIGGRRGPWALLEIGAPTSESVQYRIVRVGEPVPSGVPGGIDLRVKTITPTQTVLRSASGKTEITVELKNISSAKP